LCGVVSEAQALNNRHGTVLERATMRSRRRTCQPLAGKKPLRIEDLMEFPSVGPSLPGAMRRALPVVDKPFGAFDDVQDRFHPRILVETFSVAKRIVLCGQGIGGAIPFQIEREQSEGLRMTLPVEAPWLRLNYGLIAKRGRTLSPSATAFMAIVRSIEVEVRA
jgi:DNA-binding transcriptional LysR family regulator